MDKAAAQADLQILLGDGVLGLLSSSEVQWCLERSAVNGDYDPWIAAAEAATLLGRRSLRGGVVSWTSDGQTVKRDPGDWQRMADEFRAGSPRNSGGADPDFAFIIV